MKSFVFFLRDKRGDLITCGEWHFRQYSCKATCTTLTYQGCVIQFHFPSDLNLLERDAVVCLEKRKNIGSDLWVSEKYTKFLIDWEAHFDLHLETWQTLFRYLQGLIFHRKLPYFCFKAHWIAAYLRVLHSVGKSFSLQFFLISVKSEMAFRKQEHSRFYVLVCLQHKSMIRFSCLFCNIILHNIWLLFRINKSMLTHILFVWYLFVIQLLFFLFNP